MIDINEFDVFRENGLSLKELSKDAESEAPKIIYMTDSELEAVNFDKVKTAYTNGLNLSEEYAHSVDAILSKDDGAFFIEFKNGDLKNKKANIRDKIRDSLLIYCDITNSTIANTREDIEFVLVYNEEKNRLSSNDAIKKHYLEMSGEELVRFGMEKFKHIFFKDVHTYAEREFQEKILSKNA